MIIYDFVFFHEKININFEFKESNDVFNFVIKAFSSFTQHSSVTISREHSAETKNKGI